MVDECTEKSIIEEQVNQDLSESHPKLEKLLKILCLLLLVIFLIDVLFISSTDYFGKIVHDQYGNTYISANFNKLAGSLQLVLIKVNPIGKTTWVRKNSLNTSYISGHDLLLDHEGNLYNMALYMKDKVEGKWRTYKKDAEVAIRLDKYDSDGNLLWVKEFGDVGIKSDIRLYLEPDNTLRLYGSKGIDIMNIRIDSNGNIIDKNNTILAIKNDPEIDWGESILSFEYIPIPGSTDENSVEIRVVYSDKTYKNINEIALSPEGDVFVAYTVSYGGRQYHYFAKSNFDGEVIWSKRMDWIHSKMFVDQSNNIYMTGFTDNIGIIAHYDPDGNLRMLKKSQREDVFRSTPVISVSDSGLIQSWWRFTLDIKSVFSSRFEYEHYLIQFNEVGDELWQEKLKNSGSYRSDPKILFDNDNNVYVGDSLSEGIHTSILLSKYNQDGIKLWTWRSYKTPLIWLIINLIIQVFAWKKGIKLRLSAINFNFLLMYIIAYFR